MTDEPPASMTRRIVLETVRDRLVRYCRAVDRKDTTMVLAALDGAAVQLRDTPSTASVSELTSTYQTAFEASGGTRHIVADLTIEQSDVDSVHYEATYLRYAFAGSSPVLEALGTYSGVFITSSGEPRWSTHVIRGLP